MNWDDLRYFISVARSGSLTRAAAELRVSQSTVSRRIADLEASIGAQVFARHQSGYVLTEVGAHLFRSAETVEEGVVKLLRHSSLHNGTSAGTVRLATSESLATEVVIPSLPKFKARYPNIELQITSSLATVELGRGEADLALRVVKPLRGNLALRKVGAMSYAVYGSPAYLRQHPSKGECSLHGRAFIAWDERHRHMPAAVWLAEIVPTAEIALVTSSFGAQVAAVRAGLGLAVLPDFLVAQEGFEKVLPSKHLFSKELWIVTHMDLIASPKIKAVSDFLADHVVAPNAHLSSRLSGN